MTYNVFGGTLNLTQPCSSTCTFSYMLCIKKDSLFNWL